MSTSHYDETYFARQNENGTIGAIVDGFKFTGYSNGQDRVLDFGCGGGQMLRRLPARYRVGVDINPAARQEALKNGIDEVHESLIGVPFGLHCQ